MPRFRDVPRFAVVFTLLIAIYAVGEALDDQSWTALVFLPLVYSATAIAFNEIELSRRVLVANAVAMVVTYGLAVAGSSSGAEALIGPGFSLAALYAVTSAILLLRHVLLATRATGNVVFAALSVYLLLGVIFAVFYTQVAALDPAAFTPEQTAADSSLYYFSFITLTTVGFGDIVPAVDWLRAITVLEGLLGQIFLVVLVARLVGLQVAERTRSTTPGSPEECE